MDTGFFASKFFIVSAVVAALVLGAGAAAYAMGGVGGGEFRVDGGCRAPALVGTRLAAAPEISQTADGRERTVTYRQDASATSGGRLELCIVVGEIAVERASGQAVELVFSIASGSARAAGATEVAAAFHQDGARLVVGAWEGAVGRDRALWGSDTTSVRLTVRVPETGPWDVRAHEDVGDMRIEGILVGALDVATSVGDITVRAVDLQGNATARAEVGNVAMTLASVQSGAVAASSDVGDVSLTLPARADVGYDARGAADVGSVELRLGATEDHQSEGDGPGETESARTVGYAAKPTQVRVEGTADVGDVRIVVQ